MKPLSRLCPLLICAVFTSCDIQPVAYGNWDVQLELGTQSIRQSWSVNDGQIQLQSAAGLVTTEVNTAGSRFSWSIESDFASLPGPVNFSGTINGNTFSGTLYSQTDNISVSGNRL